MSLLCRAALVLTVMATPAAAQEQSRVYYRSGNWEAFGGTASEGRTFCGIRSSSPYDGRSLTLRFAIGDDRLVFRASKPNWSIPTGTTMPVTVQIGPNPIWNNDATGEEKTVEWSIPRDAMRAFDAQFRFGSVLWIGFPGGNEPPWTISLVGSNAAGVTLTRCIYELSTLAAPTQPYAGPARQSTPQPSQQPPTGPTQPFTTSPQAPESTATPPPTPPR